MGVDAIITVGSWAIDFAYKTHKSLGVEHRPAPVCTEEKTAITTGYLCRHCQRLADSLGVRSE